MKARFFLCSLAIIFSGVLILVSSANARLACDPVCLGDAKSAFQGCIAECKETFQEAKDSCRNINHDCAEICREAYEGCVEQPLIDLAACKLPCNTDLAAKVDLCRKENAKGTPGRDTCIDFYQVIAFQCKDSCREAANPALKICRDTFKECMIGCKLPPPTAP